MSLHALRLIAVYALTAGALLLLVHHCVRRLRAGTAILLACGPMLLAGKAFVTGGILGPIDIIYGGYPLESLRAEMRVLDTRTPLLSDVVSSYIPARKAVRDAIKNGRLPLWNRFSMAGEPLLGFQQPAALHPATWIGFALPLAQAWTFEMAFRLLLSLVCGYLFFRELGCRDPEALLGAVGWAFCDHLIFFLGYSVTAALAPFPLLLVGLRRLAREPGSKAVGITVVSLVMITLAGHPESLLHCVVGGGIYFLFELAGVSARQRISALGLAVLAGALTLGLTAVVLLPFAEIVPQTLAHAIRSGTYALARKSTDLMESLRVSVRNVLPYVYGVSGHGEVEHGSGLPAGYAGSVLLPLAALGLGSRRRAKWCFLLFSFLGLSLWARFVGVADLFGKLPLLRISVNEYFVFLAAFGTVALAVLGAERLRDAGNRLICSLIVLVCAAVIFAGFLRFRIRLLELQMSPAYLRYRLLLQLLPLGAAAVWLLLCRRRAAAGTVLAGILLTAVAQRGFEASEVYPTLPSKAFYPDLGLLRAIPREVPYRLAAVGFTLIPDSSALYGLEDVRGYEAMVLTRLAETYRLWCVAQPIWFNRIDDPTRPFLSFLNVRYVVTGPSYTPPPGWKVLAENSAGKVLENPTVVPRIFIPDYIGYVRDPDRQVELMGRIVDFRTHGIVERGAEPVADSNAWIPNGRGIVRITQYTAQDIRLEVEAQGPAVVATSIPGWPGWSVTVDGRKLPMVPYNRAFLGFPVPAGRHSARLRYWPRGFVDGLIVTTVTLFACVVLTTVPALKVACRRRFTKARSQS